MNAEKAAVRWVLAIVKRGAVLKWDAKFMSAVMVYTWAGAKSKYLRVAFYIIDLTEHFKQPICSQFSLMRWVS
jgi:hypothetical protein